MSVSTGKTCGGKPRNKEVVASSEGDPPSALQIEKLKRTAEQVRRLRRVGKGYGMWH
jgi:hypothetical protein